jgi:hypothetical protein
MRALCALHQPGNLGKRLTIKLTASYYVTQLLHHFSAIYATKETYIVFTPSYQINQINAIHNFTSKSITILTYSFHLAFRRDFLF